MAVLSVLLGSRKATVRRADSAIWDLGAQLCALALPARSRGAPKDGRDGVGIVELPGGDVDHQVVGLVVAQGQPSAVKAVERDDCGERESLVAVDERVVAGDGVQQRRGLGV